MAPDIELNGEVWILHSIEERSTNRLSTHVYNTNKHGLKHGGPRILAAVVNSIVPQHQPSKVKHERANELIEEHLPVLALDLAEGGDSRTLAVKSVHGTECQRSLVRLIQKLILNHCIAGLYLPLDNKDGTQSDKVTEESTHELHNYDRNTWHDT